MKQLLLILLLSFGLAVQSLEENNPCASFEYGVQCSLYPYSNVLDIIPSLENELQCQEACRTTTECNFFTYEQFQIGGSDCFLFRVCDSNTTSTCTEDPDCKMSVSGPVSPTIDDACCDQFNRIACDIQNALDQIFHVGEEELCQ